LGELHLRRPHATAPEASHQYQGPGQPVFDPRFHRLAPLSLAPRHPVASSSLVSGQKIAGIGEGKMSLCEAKVKSGGIQKNQGEISGEPRQRWRLAMRGMERGEGSKYTISALM